MLANAGVDGDVSRLAAVLFPDHLVAALACRFRKWSTKMTMKTVAVSEFKARCLALLDDVARTGETLLVTKRGKPLARVTPGSTLGVASPQDTLHGTVEILGDVIEPVVPMSAWNAWAGVLLSQERGKRSRKTRPRR